MPGVTKAERDKREAARQRAAKAAANKAVEKSRRSIKQYAKTDIAEGWWASLKQDVAEAILAGC